MPWAATLALPALLPSTHDRSSAGVSPERSGWNLIRRDPSDTGQRPQWDQVCARGNEDRVRRVDLDDRSHGHEGGQNLRHRVVVDRDEHLPRLAFHPTLYADPRALGVEEPRMLDPRSSIRQIAATDTIDMTTRGLVSLAAKALR